MRTAVAKSLPLLLERLMNVEVQIDQSKLSALLIDLLCCWEILFEINLSS